MINRAINKDGTIVVDPTDVADAFLTSCPPADIYVTDLDPKIKEYNDWCERKFKSQFAIHETLAELLPVAEDHDERAKAWIIPDEYKQIDVRSYLLALCANHLEYERVEYEMVLFEERDLVPLLQLMIYLVAEFRENNFVWGVGRGSSCASFCLFLIGIHKIDSLRYSLDIHEFLK